MKGVPAFKTISYTKDLQLLPASAGMQMEQLQLQIQDTRYKRCVASYRYAVMWKRAKRDGDLNLSRYRWVWRVLPCPAPNPKYGFIKTT